MIDNRLLLNDLENCIQKLGRRGVPKEEILKAQELTIKKNKSIEKVEKFRHQKNELSRKIGSLMTKKERDQAEQAKIKVSQIKQKMEKEEKSLSHLEKELEELLLYIPNFPDDKAPGGDSSKDNVEVLREGFSQDISSLKDFFLPHWEVMEELNIFDQNRAGKITGSMFAILKGSGAKLLRSLVSFAFDIFTQDYTEFIVPSLVNSASLMGTGQLPKFSEEAYHIEKDDLWAIPTGETPLTALHRQEILDEKDLPLKYMTCTPLF